MGTISDRVQLIINEYYNENESSFSRDTGINQKTLNSITSGKRKNPGIVIISQILSAKAVKINPDWLLTGKGDLKLKENCEDKAEEIKGAEEADHKEYEICPNCREKSSLIKSQEKMIKQQEYMIKCLQENIETLKGRPPLTGAAS